MKLMIASNNEHKIREIKAIVGGYFDEVLSQREAGVTLDVEENGSTFAENALLKAQAAHKLTPDGICGPASWKAISGADKYI